MGVGSGSSGSGGNTGSAASAPPATGPERVSFQTNISLVEPTTDWQFAHMLVKKETTNLLGTVRRRKKQQIFKTLVHD